MSRYEQASHVFRRCQYHIVWTPKYRFRILKNKLGKDVYRSIHVYCKQLGCIVLELNVQVDHVHLVVKVPPKLSISQLMGALKGKIALKLFNKYPHLRKNKLWGNHFWQRGYFVDSVGINEEIIRSYVRHQEKHERQEDGSQMWLMD
ncbi:IS200/IS605 family transposase [Pseudoalteromonas spongiae]|uniref:IS200/IS605 family transposase n=1 Tax=Pseudoalteromonas spongiae TaxID=298657 RepID=UPI000C2D0AB9|nr:IS200/IS605 family transposase [Pseudoalteromonas spongiae]